MEKINNIKEVSEDDPEISTANCSGKEGVNDNAAVTIVSTSMDIMRLKSIRKELQQLPKKAKRRIYFADEVKRPLVSVQEPPQETLIQERRYFTTGEILEAYNSICLKSPAAASIGIIQQLSDIQNNVDFSASLNLSIIRLNPQIMEALETIFQMVTFHYILIGNCISSNMSSLFSMLDFYDPTEEIILTGMDEEDTYLWSEFANTVKSTEKLKRIQFCDLTIFDYCLRVMFESGINVNSKIKTLRFDGCTLTRAPAFTLAHYLKYNEDLRELHLCFLNLFFKEAEILKEYLIGNCSLRLMDLSHNRIGDRGFRELGIALTAQKINASGLEKLVLVNNQLTVQCATTLNQILSCPRITLINIGANDLTDKVIADIKNSIQENKTLHFLGLQCTLLTSTGIIELAEACTLNRSLRCLNLRGNKDISSAALTFLADAIYKTSLIHIDLDTSSTSCNDSTYSEILNKVYQLIVINKVAVETKYLHVSCRDHGSLLNCGPIHIPSLIRRTRSLKRRFEVFAVSEAAALSNSRFTVVSSKIDVPKATDKTVCLGVIDKKGIIIDKKTNTKENINDKKTNTNMIANTDNFELQNSSTFIELQMKQELPNNTNIHNDEESVNSDTDFDKFAEMGNSHVKENISILSNISEDHINDAAATIQNANHLFKN